MRTANLYRYQLAMDSGVILREQRLKQREGWIVELIEGDRSGVGEIAPLPGFSHETMEQAFIELTERLDVWVQTGEMDSESHLPSVAFGLSMAMFELTGMLSEEGLYQTTPLCTGDPEDLIPALNQMTGDKVAKIKVAMHEPVRDALLVSLFLESIPDLQLRLDANRGWSLKKARKFAKKVHPNLRPRIQFIEEPCHKPGESLTFAIESGMAIGWDETLQDAMKNPEFSFADLTGAKAIVIKPTLVGSLNTCIQLIEQAQSMGLIIVVSSSLESSLGLTQLARFAKQFTPMTNPGLDTLQLFKEQLHISWPDSDLPVRTLQSQTLVWQKQTD